MANSFEDLEVWQEARALSKDTYLATHGDQFSRDYGLKDQARRAAVSVMANIAEGYERDSKMEFMRFLRISKGSCGELRSHLTIAQDLGYLGEQSAVELRKRAEILSRRISRFIRYLENRETSKAIAA